MENRFERAAKAMNKAGYTDVTPDIVRDCSNDKYSREVYVAVLGDKMITYTPSNLSYAPQVQLIVL